MKNVYNTIFIRFRSVPFGMNAPDWKPKKRSQTMQLTIEHCTNGAFQRIKGQTLAANDDRVLYCVLLNLFFIHRSAPPAITISIKMLSILMSCINRLR